MILVVSLYENIKTCKLNYYENNKKKSKLIYNQDPHVIFILVINKNPLQ